MALIDQLRQAFGGGSDEEVILTASRQLGVAPTQIADDIGYSAGGKWGNRFGASIDSYQAGLYGIAEAAGSEWAGRQRSRNDAQAQLQREYAREQGAISSYKDVGGLRDAADYLGGLAVDSAPYIAEAAVGGIAARGLLGLGRAGQIAAGAAATYPSAVGDLLQNQRDQAGQTDLGAAAALGVPYAALNAVSPVERMAMTGVGSRGLRMMDDLEGFRGGVARTGARAGVTAAAEGANEVGQEMLNQYARTGVDPRAEMFSPEALDRYGESFVGGAALGGFAGGAMGGWRRSEGYTLPTVEDQPDLLQGPVAAPAPSAQAPAIASPSEPMLDVPGQSLVPPPEPPQPVPTEEEVQAARIKQNITQQRAQFDEAKKRGSDLYGLKGKKQIEFMQQIEALRDAGSITPEEFETQINATGLSEYGNVQKFLDGKKGTPDAKPADAAPTAVVDGASGTPSVVAPGSPGAVGELPADAARGVPPAAAEPVPGGAEVVPVGGAPGAQPPPTVAAPAPDLKTTSDGRKVRVVKKGALTTPAVAPAAASVPVNVAPEETFDNYPEFVDWALQKVGAPAPVAQAFKMKGGSTEDAAEGIGEYAGQTHSTRAVGKELGVSGQTISNWVKELGPKVKDLELMHLVAKKPAKAEAAAPELVADLAVANEDGDAIVMEAPEDTTPTTSDELGEGAMDLDGDFEAVDSDPGNANSGIQIRDRMGSGAEVEANNDEVADKTYKRAKGDTPANAAAWETAAKASGDKKPVTWKDLGLGQKAWFAEMAKTGETTEGYKNISEARREGIKLSKAPASDGGSTADQVKAEIARFLTPGALSRVTVVQSQDEAQRHTRQSLQGLRVNGFVNERGRPVLIADNLGSAGKIRGVILHEMGVHAGMERAVNRPELERLAFRVQDWANGTVRTDPVTQRIAKAGLERAEKAKQVEGLDRDRFIGELIAYTVEEAAQAGITPSAAEQRSGMAGFMKAVLDMFTKALTRVFSMPILPSNLSAQDLVNVAYGFALMDTPGFDGETSLSQDIADLPPPPKEAGKGLKNWAAALVEHKWRASPSVLGALTTEQLADRFQDLPGLAGAAVRKFHEAMTRMAVRASTVMAASDNLKRQWDTLRRRHGDAVDKRFIELLHKSTISQLWPDQAYDAEANAHAATSPEAEADHAAMARAYRNLPTAYQKLYRDLQADFQSKYQAKVAALRDGIVHGYKPDEGSSLGLTEADLMRAAGMSKAERKAYLKQVGTTKLRIDTLKGMWRDLDEHRDQFPSKLDGPYFPLMRFGDHIVSVKSPEYLAAEAELAAANKEAEDFYSGDKYKPIAKLERELESAVSGSLRAKTPENREARHARVEQLEAALADAMKPVEEMTERRQQAQEALRKIKGSEQAYRVEFYESLGAATARQKQLEAELKRRGVEGRVKLELKDKYLQGLDSVQPAFMHKLSERLTAAMPEAEAAKVRNTMRELYLQMAPDRSALKSQLRRAGTAGFTEEAMRAYAASSVRDAWHISRLENAGPARQAVNELRFSDDNDAKLVGNELALRVAQNMQMHDKQWMSAATNLTYLTYLGASPAFTLTQLTQPWVISLPIIAARHGAKSVGALGKAWKDAGKLVKTSYQNNRTLGFTADPEAAAKAGDVAQDEAQMLRSLLDSGRIDITITHDLGVAAQGESNWLGKAANMSAWPAQQAEVINRVSTALAAYRLERSKGKSAEEATKFADKVVSETHLNYASENRSRWFHQNTWGGWGKVMFQFKAYQQGMVYLIGKNLLEATRGDKEAQRAVAYLLGAQLAAAGTTGLPITAPLLGAAALLYKRLSDEDEERDLREMMYQGLAASLGETGARAVTKGIPAAMGLDMSAKVGLGNILNPVPYVNDQAEGRDSVAAYWIALTGGAPAGMVGNWAEALKQASDGQWSKAAATGFPKVAGDLVRGASYATKGLTDSRGNEIVGADDMSAGDVAAKMLGFTSTDTARVQERRRAYFDARENVKSARETIIRDLAQARMSGERDQDAEEAMQRFNARNPGQRITLSTVLQATQRRRTHAENTRSTGGLPVDKRTRSLAEEFPEN